jgi:hypothetical protein
MIHSTLHGPPAARRRIAVLEIPRTEVMRLGRIGTIRGEPFSVSGTGSDSAGSAYGVDAYSGVYPTVTNDPAPSSAAQWLASIVQQQADARETTPGTLTYTPAPNGPVPNVAPWNSWAGPCATGSAPSSGAAATTSSGRNEHRFWLWLAAGLGAAGSAVYLYDHAKGKK